MFLLYQKKYKTYPEEVAAGGFIYHINADFRNILRICEMIDDENIPDNKKINKLKEWFFEYDAPEYGIVEIFVDFFSTGMGMGDIKISKEYAFTAGEEQQFCYNFDAKEIYAGFLSEYGIDLIEADFLHWYKFRVLLDNLSPESAFKRKVELRFMDLNNLTAGNGRKFAELARAKEAVQLPERKNKTNENQQDIQNIDEFMEIWGKAGGN